MKQGDLRTGSLEAQGVSPCPLGRAPLKRAPRHPRYHRRPHAPRPHASTGPCPAGRERRRGPAREGLGSCRLQRGPAQRAGRDPTTQRPPDTRTTGFNGALPSGQGETKDSHNIANGNSPLLQRGPAQRAGRDRGGRCRVLTGSRSFNGALPSGQGETSATMKPTTKARKLQRGPAQRAGRDPSRNAGHDCPAALQRGPAQRAGRDPSPQEHVRDGPSEEDRERGIASGLRERDGEPLFACFLSEYRHSTNTASGPRGSRRAGPLARVVKDPGERDIRLPAPNAPVVPPVARGWSCASSASHRPGPAGSRSPDPHRV